MKGMGKISTMRNTGSLETGVLISNLNKEIDRILSQIIPPRIECAVLDFPDYSNPGDSAIWLGQKAWLEKNGNPVVYVADRRDYNPEALGRRIGSGFILINGGGNFGDLWPDHQSFREQVVQDFPNNPIVQMPQSMHYSDPSRLEETASKLNGHRQLHLLWRDMESLDAAQKHFKARHSLCPDMAFTLDRLVLEKVPEYSMVWLSRTDKESVGSHSLSKLEGILVKDWIEEPESELVRLKASLSTEIMQQGFDRDGSLAEYMEVCDRLARERMNRGAEILRSGRMVMTDRLHAHIFSLLLDIPHIILDNSYGKLSRFHKQWTAESRICLALGNASDATPMKLTDNCFVELLQEYGLSHEESAEKFGVLVRGIESAREEAKEWLAQIRMTVGCLDSMLPEDSTFLLIDDEQFRPYLPGHRMSFCKVFAQGVSEYMGPPADERDAMETFEELQRSGIQYTVVCGPSFWWMEHYPGLGKRIRARARLIHASDLLHIYATVDHPVAI